jgi:hypothetical protein
VTDKTFIVKFRPPDLPIRSIVASTVEMHGDHLALLNARGELAALFLLDVVESWSEIPLKPSSDSYS